MSIVGDVVDALRQVTEWNELQNLPKRIDALERKIQELEHRSKDNPSNERCEHCGSLKIKITGTRRSEGRFGTLGLRDTGYTCQEAGCGKVTWLMDKPT